MKVGLPLKTFLHAEISALLRAGDKKVHKIRVERFDANGEPANAEPCPICKEAIRLWGVSYTEYTN
jgi:tRNA(Arg) A34 adenosine deaminase TadA